MYFLKMLYFADRHHLRHYGNTISCDTYKAMKLGPVAMGTFDILKRNMLKAANNAEISLLNDVKIVDEYNVIIAKQDEDELSESDKISLNFAIEQFGHLDQFRLSAISHDYPEWKKYKDMISDGIKEGGKVSFKMSLGDFFEDPQDTPMLTKNKICGDPFEEDKEFLELMKSGYLSVSWRPQATTQVTPKTGII